MINEKSNMFVFEAPDNKLYKTPESYVYTLKHGLVEWGVEIKVYPVCNDKILTYNHDTIVVTFNHEGSVGTVNDIIWMPTKDSHGYWEHIISSKNITIYDDNIITLFYTNETNKCYVSEKHSPNVVRRLSNMLDNTEVMVLD